jgi:pyruvate/2-oxoglutarate dehydrogenase complex dihydrolipoamide acyltransferase (E2) component
MAEIVRMPKLSDTMTEGVVAAWHKKVGDKVKSGEVLAEIETDKATMEFESFTDGVLLHIGVEKGKAAVDSVLAVLGKGRARTSPSCSPRRPRSTCGRRLPKPEEAEVKEEKDLEQEKEDNAVREEALPGQPHLPVRRRPPHLLPSCCTHANTGERSGESQPARQTPGRRERHRHHGFVVPVPKVA